MTASTYCCKDCGHLIELVGADGEDHAPGVCIVCRGSNFEQTRVIEGGGEGTGRLF